MPNERQRVIVGVLALQGAFAEHLQHLSLVAAAHPELGVEPRLIRTTEQLSACHGLILPGGESTTMSLIADRMGMLEPLRRFARSCKGPDAQKAIWGTCAGMILLSDHVVQASTKEGGQQGLTGLAISIVRNQWGRQTESFEYPLTIAGITQPELPFPGIFIRAPVVHTLLAPKSDSQHLATGSDSVHVLSEIEWSLLPQPRRTQSSKAHQPDDNSRTGDSRLLPLGPDANVVALRQERILATAFHPELTRDSRLHEYFVRELVLEQGKL
ncbi:uncharacterized protein L969DRAFT_86341 [Mixia osmundae IAM 14324]|uniref:glutaminase n=1 Tax=Mixia osmundae (strain CBS 9802 / IAM 14324 / JCM 22182 / KY 12970) TaxID=764103 RepID=G7DUG1_MIXOS|nr:uncharacterized protein L969DRAFT_86341 [Mixia osmundae IAM 14324]KEI41094.1 hypothetical protein L969DRAFT_86341 [Mixia osmundae IAM 14324]GAA94221.1 hypothetical protein E5Q_00870 [Mixia osmundae IAM 14324]